MYVYESVAFFADELKEHIYKQIVMQSGNWVNRVYWSLLGVHQNTVPTPLMVQTSFR